LRPIGLGGFELCDFRFGGGDLVFEAADFLGVVQLGLGPGELLTQLCQALVQHVDLFFDFFVHCLTFSDRNFSDLGVTLTGAVIGDKRRGAFKEPSYHRIPPNSKRTGPACDRAGHPPIVGLAGSRWMRIGHLNAARIV